MLIHSIILNTYLQDKTGFEVFPSSAKFYPSSPLYSTLTVHGTGFKEGMSLTLTPKLKVGVDYDVVYIDKHTLNLSLRPNKKWPVGILSVTRLNNVSLGDGVVQIAEFLAFPYIYSSNNDIYLSKVQDYVYIFLNSSIISS